jgi:hypothetical protein
MAVLADVSHLIVSTSLGGYWFPHLAVPCHANFNTVGLGLQSLLNSEWFKTLGVGTYVSMPV